MARPSKQYKETVKKLEEAFILGSTIPEACFYADIAKQTYYNWVNKNPKLLDRFEALQQSPILKARKAIVEGLDDNPEFALRFLERKLKNEFGLHSPEMDNKQVIRLVIDGEEDKQIGS